MTTCYGDGNVPLQSSMRRLVTHQPAVPFDVYPLAPGSYYGGPEAIDANNMCYCNTVSYDLLMGCAVCQGGDLTTCVSFNDCTGIYDLKCLRHDFLAGHNIHKIAQKPYLLRRKSATIVVD